jgi:hypothetical protein
MIVYLKFIVTSVCKFLPLASSVEFYVVVFEGINIAGWMEKSLE